MNIKQRLGRGTEVTRISPKRIRVKKTWSRHFKYGPLKYELDEVINTNSDVDQVITNLIEAHKACQMRIKEIEAELSPHFERIRASYFATYYNLEVAYSEHFVEVAKITYDQDPLPLISDAIMSDKARLNDYFNALILRSGAEKHSGIIQLTEALKLKYGNFFHYTITRDGVITLFADGIELFRFQFTEQTEFYSLMKQYPALSALYETEHRQTMAQIYEFANALNQSPNQMWECRVVRGIIEINLVTHPKIKAVKQIHYGDVKAQFIESMRYLLNELRCRGFYYE